MLHINRAKSNEFCYEQKSLQNHDDLRRYTIYFNRRHRHIIQPTSQPFRTNIQWNKGCTVLSNYLYFERKHFA